MPKPNIYAVGGTVQASGGIYLPRTADATLLEFCLRGDYVHILTTRQVGKSSLMIRTVERLSEHGVRAVVIDISSIGVELSEEQWYFSLLKAIKDQLAVEINLLTWWQANSHINEPERFVTFLKKVVLPASDGPVVVFIDEIDTTRALRFTDDFFIAVRSLFNGRAQDPELKRLSFVLIGVAATPQDLIKARDRTPYNIVGTAVELTDFTFEEARPLADGLGLTDAHAREVLGWVMKWTSGHPYLTQRICHDIARAGRSGWTEAEVDQLVTGTFSEDKSVLDSNLHFVRSMLTTQAPDAEKVLKTYRKVRRGMPLVFDEERSQTKCHLKLSGVVRRQGRTLRIRNRIYGHLFDEKWIREHLPVNWPRRLQRTVMVLLVLLLLITIPTAVFALYYAGVAKAKAHELADTNAKLEKSLKEEAKARQQAEKDREEAELARDRAEEAEEKARLTSEELQGSLVREQAANRDLAAARQRAEQEARHAKQAEGRAEAERWESASAGAFQAIGRSAREIDSNKIQRALKYLAEADKKLKSVPGRRRQGSSLLRFLYAQTLPSLEAQFASIGHQGDVNYAAFSPDGKSVVTAGKDMVAKLWDMSKGEGGLLPLRGHEAQVRHAAFSSDSQTVITGSDDGTARLWDAGTGKPGVVLQHSQGGEPIPVHYVGFNLDGTQAVTTGADGTVRLWDAKTGAVKRLLKGHQGWVFSAGFSPTGKYVLTAGEDGSARVWNTASGEGTILDSKPASTRANSEDQRADVYHAAFSPDGRYVVTAHRDDIARVWEVGEDGWETASSKPIHVLKGHDRPVLYAAFSHLGEYLVTTSIDGKAIIWDMRDTASTRGQAVHTLGGSPESGHTGLILRAAFSANDKYLVTVGMDRSAQVWNVSTGNRLAALYGHRAPVNSVAFSSSGEGDEFILTSSDDGTAKIWKWREARKTSATLVQQSSPAAAATFSPDGQRVVTTERDTATVWDVQDHRRRRVATLEGHRDMLFYAAFDHSGTRVVTASADETAIVWDRVVMEEGGSPVEKYVISKKLLGHKEHVHHAEFSPDGNLIITASDDGTAIIWDAGAGLPLRSLKGHPRMVTSAAFSASGKFAVTTSSDGITRVWEVESGKLLKELEGHLGRVYAASFAPNRFGIQEGERDRWVASAGEDGTVRIWDWKKDDEARVLEGHVGKVYSVAFNHDGALLLSAGEDGSAIVFDVESGDVLTRLKPGTGHLMWASLSRDSRRVVAAGLDGSVTLWDFPFLAEEIKEAEQQRIDEMVSRLILYKIVDGALIQRRPDHSLWVNPSFKDKKGTETPAKEGDLE